MVGSSGGTGVHVLTKLQMQYIDIDVFHKHSIEERAVALTFNEPRRESSSHCSQQQVDQTYFVEKFQTDST